MLLKREHRVAQASDPVLALSSSSKQYLTQAITFFALYCIGGVLGQATTNIRSSNVGPVWPAYGVALAAFLVCGYRMWPAIALGAFAVAFFSPVTHIAALGQAVAATLAAFSGTLLLRRFAFDCSLSRLRDALGLVALGALGSALVSATLGIGVLYATHEQAYSGLSSAWLIYWLGDATGVLLVTPLILKRREFLGFREGTRITEVALLLLLLTGVCYLIFGDPNLVQVRLHVLAFAVLPFVMWAAIRFGVTGAASSNFLIATFATLETAFGFGPFATSTPFTNAILLDVFFAVLSVTGLTLASAIAEREQGERQRGALEARLAAEQVVRLSEERLRLAQEAARIGAFERDVRTGIVNATSELDLMYGLPPGSFDGTNISFFVNLIHPDDRARVEALIDGALKTGEPTKGEWRVVWPDGSVHWIAGRWRALMDESGEPLRMVGVNVDVSDRKSAEEALLELNRTLEAQSSLLQSSEELLKTFVKNVPAPVAMLDRDMRYLQVSDRWCTDYLPGRAQILGCSHYEIFPDMPERWKEVHRHCLEGETQRAEEDRWDGQDGPHWARWEVRPWRTPEGTVGGVLILAEDITRRKQMEEALSTLSRKLIASQEQERSRIGRELHDDINQQLAMLSLELQQVVDNPSLLETHGPELRKKLDGISSDVQSLSHELHSSKLEYLGVVAGIRSWCGEFAQRQRVEVDFKSEVSRSLPMEIGLTLFRVLQEALHNAVKHGGAKRIEVQMTENLREVLLAISESGRGFDFETAMLGTGLGLISMRERVRLVNGSITIDSKPKRGTSIQVRIPIPSDSERAAG